MSDPRDATDPTDANDSTNTNDPTDANDPTDTDDSTITTDPTDANDPTDADDSAAPDGPGGGADGRPAGPSGGLTPALWLLIALSTLLGAGHHLDHLVRGNHVGWPVTPSVNAFTYSLAIYPLIAVGLALSVTDRAGAGYWTAVFAAGAAMLTFSHLSPWAVEPPGDVIVPYSNPAFGYLAFAVLLGLILAVTAGAAYSLVRWRRARRGRRA